MLMSKIISTHILYTASSIFKLIFKRLINVSKCSKRIIIISYKDRHIIFYVIILIIAIILPFNHYLLILNINICFHIIRKHYMNNLYNSITLNGEKKFVSKERFNLIPLIIELLLKIK